MSEREIHHWKKNGKIECPGDSCPHECNDFCPIWLHTKAAHLIEQDKYADAILLYLEATRLEPEFYEAWNNLGGCYGAQGNYSKAYDCYLRAHQFDRKRTAPLFGLCMASRDLGKYEKCLDWCERYKKVSDDGRVDEIYETAKKHLDAINKANEKPHAANKEEKAEFVRFSGNKKWAVIKFQDKYWFTEIANGKNKIFLTPGGVPISADSLELANIIICDLEKYGSFYRGPESIIPWHYTFVEYFSNMDHTEIEAELEKSFLNKSDWTYVVKRSIFGEEKSRKKDIKKWLTNCTKLQLTAACCIGNGYHSLNLAYILAGLMENFSGTEREVQIIKLAYLVESSGMFGSKDEIMTSFNNFETYYGSDLSANEKIVHNSDLRMD